MNLHKILVVEDEPTLRETYLDIICSFGYAPLPAKDGQEGIDMFLSNAGIELIILDMMMPRKNGYEVFMEVRKINTRIPIIICTGYYNDPAHINQMVATGRTEFLRKPVGLSDLQKAIEKYLHNDSSSA
jgi:CheY-like chemotaxis protein